MLMNYNYIHINYINRKNHEVALAEERKEDVDYT